MPRFFFNVRDGHDIPDHEGEELENWHIARQYAIRYAGCILDNEADRLALGEEWRMEISNEDDLVLFRLEFSVKVPPEYLKKRRPS